MKGDQVHRWPRTQGFPRGCRRQGSPAHQRALGSRAPRAGPEGWGDAGRWHPARTRRLTCRATETPVLLALSPPPTRAAPLGLGGAAGWCAGWRCARTTRSLPSRIRSVPSMPSPARAHSPRERSALKLTAPRQREAPPEGADPWPAPPPREARTVGCAVMYAWSLVLETDRLVARLPSAALCPQFPHLHAWTALQKRRRRRARSEPPFRAHSIYLKPQVLLPWPSLLHASSHPYPHPHPHPHP